MSHFVYNITTQKSVFKEEKRGIFKEKCISVDKTCKAFEAVWSYEIISKCWIFFSEKLICY